MTEPGSCEAGVIYARVGEVDLRGDLYRPDGDGPFPVLVGVPGGAWRTCVRASWRDWGEYLSARGIALFAVDYRVAAPGRKAYPEAVCDILSAIRFIRGQAQDRHLDPDRIGLFGISAGAHLAALAALAPDHPLYAPSRSQNAFGHHSAAVKTLVTAYGIFDLFAHWQHDLALNPAPDADLVRNLLGKDPFEDQQLYADASPIRQVTYAANGLSVLAAWGTEDEFVSRRQSERFVRVLQQARFNVRTYKAVGASHFWANQPLDQPSNDSARFAPHLTQFLSMAL